MPYGQEPSITQTDPKAYWLWLRSQGVPASQAVQMVEQRFGPPKDQGNGQQSSGSRLTQGLVSIGGLATGAIIGHYIKTKVGPGVDKWIDRLTGKEVAEDVVQKTAQQLGQQGGQQAIQQGAQQGIQTGAEQAGQVVQTPKVLSVKDNTATVELQNGQQAQVPAEAINDQNFWSGVNWAAVANGAVSLMQAYQAYQAYKQKDYVGAGIAAGSAVTAGAAAASAAGYGGSATASMAAWAPYAGIAAGLYGGYQTAEMIGDTAAGSQRNKQGAVSGAASGAALGAGVGSIVPGVGTAIGAVVGAVVGAAAGLVGSWTGSHKGKAQFMRDNIRDVLKQNQILDDKYQGTLADGSRFDFGKDGSALKWKNIDKLASENPNSWNAAIPLTDALAAGYGFVGQKASDISAWYGRAAISNANNDPNVAIANAQHFAQQQGVTFDLIKSKLDEAIKDNRINQNQYDYYMNGARQLTANISNVTQGQLQPAQQPAIVQRAKKGEVVRQSPGLYRNDQGQLIRGKDMRSALQNAYNKTKPKEETKVQ